MREPSEARSTARVAPAPGEKGALGRLPPKTLAHFFLPLLSPHPTAAIGEREGDGAGDAARAGGGGGAAEHYSPEVHAAVASAQLRRASLVGALRPNPCARGIHRIRSDDGEGGHITPVVGLPAALGSRGRPARRRCGGDGGAARGQAPSVRPLLRCSLRRRRRRPIHGPKVSLHPSSFRFRVRVHRIWGFHCG